jgi:sugar lactone lactonase YvrE
MSTNGNLYVTEAFSGQVSKIIPGSKITRVDVSQVASFGVAYIGNGSVQPEYQGVRLPNGIAINNTNNNLFVADSGNGLIREGSGL